MATGFSLIEVLVSVSIFLMVFTSSWELIHASRKNVQKAEQIQQHMQEQETQAEIALSE